MHYVKLTDLFFSMRNHPNIKRIRTLSMYEY